MNGAAKQYDVVVVGGGIQGVGVAEAAAAAGHSVLVLEKRSLAAGTSSKSSKLIHGGLRYLESGQFGLVRESLRERRILLEIAPQLVQLKPFLLPVYRSTRRRPWQLRLGLSMYAVLGGLKSGTRFGSIPRQQWENLDGLETRNLQTVLQYYDAQTDDAALTRAVMKTAQSLGAELALPARFLGAQLRSSSVIVRYVPGGGGEHECEAKVLVNATGAWGTEVANSISPAIDVPPLELVQGTHILVPGQLSRGIYYVESPRDGRAVFVMPWKGRTLIGTTETRFRGNIDDVRPTTAEINYLQQIAGRYFPRYQEAPIEGSFAGLRVLPAGKDHAFYRPRETMIDVERSDKPRVASIYGGKLTGWRATAEHVMQRLSASLPSRRPRADTRTLRLSMPD